MVEGALRKREAGPRQCSPSWVPVGPSASQMNALCTASAHPVLACAAPKGRVALCTCPRFQVQLLQDNVEKEDDGLHELGGGHGVGRAPGKDDGRAAAAGLLQPWGAPLLKPAWGPRGVQACFASTPFQDQPCPEATSATSTQPHPGATLPEPHS